MLWGAPSLSCGLGCSLDFRASAAVAAGTAPQTECNRRTGLPAHANTGDPRPPAKPLSGKRVTGVALFERAAGRRTLSSKGCNRRIHRLLDCGCDQPAPPFRPEGEPAMRKPHAIFAVTVACILYGPLTAL